jgi:hypothetical protein
MSKPRFRALAAACALSLAASVHAEVLNFNNTAGVEMPGGYASIDIYTVFEGPAHYQDYVLTTTQPRYLYLAGYWNSQLFCGGSSLDCAYAGSDYMLAGSFKFQRADDRAFALNGFDLDNYYDNAAEAQASFTVTGLKMDGSTVTTVITLDDLPNAVTYGTPAAFNHFDFAGFTNLRSFEVTRNTPTSWDSLALDNVDVTPMAAVPEPSTWLMLGAGLLGLGAYAKRRKA